MTSAAKSTRPYDFKDDKDIFNAYYRANRSSIYRNPEGVEFPIFDDGTVIKQGTGEILAYLLSGRTLEILRDAQRAAARLDFRPERLGLSRGGRRTTLRPWSACWPRAG